jgi:hypothetical protein
MGFFRELAAIQEEETLPDKKRHWKKRSTGRTENTKKKCR